MKKTSIVLSALTLIIFSFQLAFAQHKAMEKSGMSSKMGAMSGAKMGMMAHHDQEKMSMMNDPVLKTLHRFGCPGYLLKSAEVLGLNEKQIATLTQLKLEFKKSAVKIKADIDVATLEIEEAMLKNSPDFKAVKAAINTITQKQKELREQFLGVLQKARNVLTTEQLQKLANLAKKGCQGGKHGHGMPMKSKMDKSK